MCTHTHYISIRLEKLKCGGSYPTTTALFTNTLNMWSLFSGLDITCENVQLADLEKVSPEPFHTPEKIKSLLLFVKKSWKAVHPELCKVAVIDRSSFTSQTTRRSLLTLTYNVNNPVGIKDHTWRKASSPHRLARTSPVLARAVLGSFLIWQNKIHLKDHCTTTLLSQRFEPKQLFKPKMYFRAPEILKALEGLLSQEYRLPEIWKTTQTLDATGWVFWPFFLSTLGIFRLFLSVLGVYKPFRAFWL